MRKTVLKIATDIAKEPLGTVTLAKMDIMGSDVNTSAGATQLSFVIDTGVTAQIANQDIGTCIVTNHVRKTVENVTVGLARALYVLLDSGARNVIRHPIAFHLLKKMEHAQFVWMGIGDHTVIKSVLTVVVVMDVV